MMLGDPLFDAIAFIAVGWAVAILFLPFLQWIDYKRDCKKCGMKIVDEIWRRMR